jgi:hypothetical protein
VLCVLELSAMTVAKSISTARPGRCKAYLTHVLLQPKHLLLKVLSDVCHSYT